MKKQSLRKCASVAGVFLFALSVQLGTESDLQAQCATQPGHGGVGYSYPQGSPYHVQRVTQHVYGHQYHYQPQQYHRPGCQFSSTPIQPQYHQPGCPLSGNPGTVVIQPVIVDPGLPSINPEMSNIGPETVIGNPQTEVTGELKTGPAEGSGTKNVDVVQPAQPWKQWGDMPPLRGDFPAMIHQVVGDVDWLLVAHGDKFSPDVKSLLAEGKQYLDTSCQVCDEDTDLFAGADTGNETVRDVTQQLKQFRDLVAQSLQQPQMQTLQQAAAPARADKSKLGKVFGSLDAETKSKMFAMFALETLQKRADSLVASAEAVEQGTFRPVDVELVAGELKVGDAAPEFTVQTIDGDTVSLSSMKGKNVVVVFNRGSFCPFCMNQVKQLMEVSPQLKDQDAEVVVIFRELKPGTEVKDGIEGLRGFKQKASPPFTLAIDFGSSATPQYSTEGHFSTYVIGKDGNVASVLRGVKYIRPSGEAIVKATAAANETPISLN